MLCCLDSTYNTEYEKYESYEQIMICTCLVGIQMFFLIFVYFVFRIELKNPGPLCGRARVYCFAPTLALALCQHLQKPGLGPEPPHVLPKLLQSCHVALLLISGNALQLGRDRLPVGQTGLGDGLIEVDRRRRYEHGNLEVDLGYLLQVRQVCSNRVVGRGNNGSTLDIMLDALHHHLHSLRLSMAGSRVDEHVIRPPGQSELGLQAFDCQCLVGMLFVILSSKDEFPRLAARVLPESYGVKNPVGLAHAWMHDERVNLEGQLIMGQSIERRKESGELVLLLHFCKSVTLNQCFFLRLVHHPCRDLLGYTRKFVFSKG